MFIARHAIRRRAVKASGGALLGGVRGSGLPSRGHRGFGSLQRSVARWGTRDDTATAAFRWRRQLCSSATSTEQARVQALKQANEVREAFNRWRREHTLFLVSSGIFVGAGAFGLALYLYLDRYPSAIEYFVVEKAVRAFHNSLSFESRMKVFQGLPEPNLPNFESLILKGMDEYIETSTNSTKNDQKYKSAKNQGEVGRSTDEATTAESIEEASAVLSTAKFTADSLLQSWADLVDGALNRSDSTWVVAAKQLMRKDLKEEIQTFPDLESRLSALSELYPPSVERNLLISEEIDSELAKGNLIPGNILERFRPQSPEYSADIMTGILIHAIAFFPGPINQLIQFLDSPVSEENDEERWKIVTDIVQSLNDAVAEQDSDTDTRKIRRRSSRRILEDHGLLRPALEKTLVRIKRQYDELPGSMKGFVLNEALRTTITLLPLLPRIGGVRPYDLYVRAIDEDLIGPLRRDARITEDILTEVKSIFLAMPPALQTRVLLTAVRHPIASADPATASPDAQAELVRDLLSSGGVVAVKLAQMLAEHPLMPRDYQIMLGSLRDENEPMSATTFWWQIPSVVRSSIDSLGPCLGTGSVKQANLAQYKDGNKYAVCVLRGNVEDEALSSISAMETSEELGMVATRLGRLVYGEFNLFGEGEVLQEFAQTEIGLNPTLHVVRVRHNSPKCLVEEVAEGVSVGQALEAPTNTEEEKDEQERILDVLIEYHRTVMSAFIDTGVIHSDVHLGNANYVKPKTPPKPIRDSNGKRIPVIERGKKKEQDLADELNGAHFVLYDVGQFERIGLPDTKALLWTLAAVSTDENRVMLKNICMQHLASTASLKNKDIKDEGSQRKEIKRRLSIAFAEAIEPNAEGESPDKRTAYMFFLRAAENHGVNMPKGAFSVAKMIDGIVSQQDRYGLPPVVDDAIEAFLKSTLTWGELADIGARKIKIL